MRILLKRVGEDLQEMNIEDTLEAKQKLVDGLIEVVPMYGRGLENVLIVCNEEGKLLDLPFNFHMQFDYIAGDCFFIGDDYETGDFKSLTDEQIKSLKSFFKGGE